MQSFTFNYLAGNLVMKAYGINNIYTLPKEVAF